MKSTLFYFIVCLSNALVLAHEPNEAFFSFIQKENSITVHIEFPWTIRNALLDFNPKLESSTDKKDFENTFIQYIKKNLVLKDKDGNAMQFQSFEEVKHSKHSHQHNYRIIFAGKHLKEVANTVMFNIYNNQVNYNTVTFNSGTERFTTKKDHTYFTLRKKHTVNYWYLGIVIIPAFYIFNRFFNTKTIHRRRHF